MESDIGICQKGEGLEGETVSVLFDVSLGHYGEFLPGDRTCCRDKKTQCQPTTMLAYKTLCKIKYGLLF